MRSIFVLFFVLGIAVACAPAPTPIPTAVPTATPNVEATAAAQAQAAATAQAQASATAQAVSSATAQAAASMTAQAQASATTQAQATVRAQQTASAAATTQAFNSYLDTLAQSAKKVYGPTDGVLELKPNTLLVPGLYTSLNLRNFIAEIRFFNPADPAVHPWDYGIAFRRPPLGKCAPEYRFVLNSEQSYRLIVLTGKTQPDQLCESTGSSVRFSQFDLSPTGSNLVRLIVQDKAAYVFVNGQSVTTLDVSGYDGQGDIWIGTGFQSSHSFPGLATKYTGFTVSSLP